MKVFTDLLILSLGYPCILLEDSLELSTDYSMMKKSLQCFNHIKGVPVEWPCLWNNLPFQVLWTFPCGKYEQTVYYWQFFFCTGELPVLCHSHPNLGTVAQAVTRKWRWDFWWVSQWEYLLGQSLGDLQP